MTCSDCIHYKGCFERRGACRDYKTLEEIRKEIESVNQSKKPAKRAETNSTSVHADTQRGDKHGTLHKSQDAQGPCL